MSKQQLFNKSTWFILLATAIAFGSSSFAGPDKNKHHKPVSTPTLYNEAFDENGNVRAPYLWVWDVYKKKTKTEKEKIEFDSKRDFQGDNKLLPIPRMLSEDEYQLLTRGVDQRGRALQAFMNDYYSGKKQFLKAGIIPKDVLKSITTRNHEQLALKGLKGFTPRFWYGPDIVRDAQGNFLVVEDNTGYVGGIGDLIKARESILKQIPDYAPGIKPGHDPEQFYEEMVGRYYQIAKEYGGSPVLFSYKKSLASDNESARTQKIFENLGVTTVRIDPSEKSLGLADLKVKSDGLYYNKKKIGLVIFDIEPVDVEPRHPMVKDKADYDRRGIEGFWDLVRDQKLGVINPVGIDFTNDKGFYVYMEQLVRFYLHEEPILKNIDTQWLAQFDSNGKPYLDQKLLKKIMTNREEFVVKGVDGRGGDAVFIGKKMSNQEMIELKKKIEENPQHYIAQKYLNLSVLDEHLVDLRLLADVGEKGSIVAPIPWGRASPISGSGKVNISSNGKETVVLVSKSEEVCNVLLKVKKKGSL